ncbi:DALR anticodon-binding domain-containing protein [Nostoc sp. LEGE 06077]|uniref:DALR anticodon-binding domain-containing protein n=1 Tax=Nostoc sp. LEGE 06077 TaxID=915325 RepID=UPI002AD53B02|nr:DALR anticodon-binding domain-containing protein [Nostoc sp. LEGE 06077]
MDIADSIGYALSATSGDVFSVKIVPPGWIYLELTPVYLASWLQHWVMECIGQVELMGIEEITPNVKNHNPTNIFAAQYAHARCCSLILLGHHEGLIKLTEPLPDTNLEFWRLVPQQPIPWLNHDNQLCFHHSTEKDLLAQLVQVADNLGCSDISDAVNWQKVALKLSQAVENFWSKCRIWGDVKIYSPELAQARLGLVIITQRMLRFLLVEKLGVTAPWEL